MRTEAAANTAIYNIQKQQIAEQNSIASNRARGINKKQEITDLFYIFDMTLQLNQHSPVLTDQQRDAFIDYLIP